MEQEFVSSVEIDHLGKNISNGIHKVTIKNKELHYPEKPSNTKATEAVLKLCFKWNQNKKSRDWVLKLIKAFYNLDLHNKVESFDDYDKPNCCVLYTKLIGKNEFVTILKKFKKLKEMLNAQQDIERRLEKVDSVAEWVENIKQNKDFTNPHFGYYSNKFKFPICLETYYAIKAFCSWAYQYNVKEIVDFVNNSYEKVESSKKNSFGSIINTQRLEALRKQHEQRNRQKMKNLMK